MNIDWAEEWRKRRENSAWAQRLQKKGLTSAQFYDQYKLGDRHEEYVKWTGYPGRILERMKDFVTPASVLLDIGAGAGAYTIPFAKLASEVTVVEPSQGQVSRLLKRIDGEGLKNIRIINKAWEDVSEEELGSYDLVNAAHCFAMPDIRTALAKMWEVTRGVLFLIDFVEHDFQDVFAMIVEGYDRGPDYIYLYNILYQAGIKANVEINTRRYLLPLDYDLENLRSSWDLSPAMEQKILKHLSNTGRIVEQGGNRLVKHTYRDAIIWCKKEDQN